MRERPTKHRKLKHRHWVAPFAVTVWTFIAALSAQKIDPSFADVVDRVRPAVVTISVTRSRGSEFGWESEHGGTVRQTPSTRAYGSGIIFDTEGRILTNRHVIQGAVSIRVGFADGRTVTGTLIGQDPETDLALLQVSAGIPSTHVAQLGDSDSLRVGDWVIAFGSPFGYHHTVSVGVVSATGRQLDAIEQNHATPFHSFIQTDAAINPGNSGGPLITVSGQVVGINTAYNPAAPGIAFAIPINLAVPIANQLARVGRVSRGYLGIVPQRIDEELARSLDLVELTGLLIADVRPDGPADRAGLSRGDVLLELGGRPVQTVSDYGTALAALAPGGPIEAVVYRGGQTARLSVTPGNRPQISAPPRENSHSAGDAIGIEVINRWSLEAGRLGAKKAGQGVIINYVSPGSSADQKYLKKGDAILEIGGEGIWREDDYAAALEKSPTDRPVLILIRPAGQKTTRYVALSL